MTDDKAASQVASALFLDGIIDGSVNLQDSTLTIKYDSSKVTADKIVETMEQSLPFAVSLVSVQKPGGSLIPSIVVGFSLAVVLLVGVWLFMRRTSGKGQPE
jgi:copper chaperone CopZ